MLGVGTSLMSTAVRWLNYALPVPRLLEGFESAADWTAGGAATLATEQTRKVQGSGALSIKADGTQAPQATKTNLGTYSAADLGVIAYCQDLGDDPEYQTATSLDIRLGVGGTYRGSSGVTNPAVSDLNLGKMWSSFDISDLSGHPSAASQIDLRVQGANSAPKCETVIVDALYRNAKARPTVLLTFDNAYIGQYTIGLPKLAQYGIRASCFVGGDGPLGDVIGGSSHVTVAQLQEMYAAGWDVCPNGTADDSQMTSHATVADAITDIDGVKAWLVSNGFTRGLDCMCYPNGTARVAGNKVQVTSVTSNGTAVVTMTSTTGITTGRKVAGALVPRSPATTVVSVDSSTQLTLSAAIPAGTSAMSFTDTSGAFHTGKLPAALKAAGYRFGRLTSNGTRFTRFGLGDQGLVFPAYNLDSAFADVTALRTRLDAVAKRGQTICFLCHNIEVGGSGIDTDKFNSFADEFGARKAAGTMDFLTLSQFMARDGNAQPPG